MRYIKYQTSLYYRYKQMFPRHKYEIWPVGAIWSVSMNRELLLSKITTPWYEDTTGTGSENLPINQVQKFWSLLHKVFKIWYKRSSSCLRGIPLFVWGLPKGMGKKTTLVRISKFWLLSHILDQMPTFSSMHLNFKGKLLTVKSLRLSITMI